MHPMDNVKYSWIINNAVITDADDPVGAYGDANPVSVDTLGWSRADIIVRLGASDIDMTALGVYSGNVVASGADDTDFAAVTGLQASGATGVGRIPQDDDDNKTFRFSIDLKNDDIGRYLCLDATAGDGSAGSYITALCILSEPNEAPSTDTEAGVAWTLRA